MQKFPFLDSHKFNMSWDYGQIAVVEPSQSEMFYNYIMDSQANVLGGFEVKRGREVWREGEERQGREREGE
jgi:hypothetical protein